MANNIVGNAPNAIVAKATVSFATAGLNSTNTEIVYLVDAALQSWKPGRAINGISGFVANKGYYMVAKQDMDLESVVAPPVTVLTQLGTPGSFAAAVQSSTQINLSWAAVTSATGYVLQRATNVGFTTGLTTLVNGTNITSFNDTGLTASTHYYYRVKAVASGYSDSNYATDDDTTSAPGPGYLTWNSIETDIEQYNTSKGLRKKAAASAGWVNSQAWSNEQLSAGETVTFKWDVVGYQAFGLNATRTANNNTTPDWAFVAQQAGTLIYGNGAPSNDSGVAMATTDLLRFNYSGSSIIIQRSVDNGANWTNLGTMTGASGSYYVVHRIYANNTNTGCSEIYK